MGNSAYRPFRAEQLEKIHSATLRVLEKTGLRVDFLDFHAALERKGARVDRATRVVRFPPSLIEECIETLRQEISKGRRQFLLNGVTNPRWTPPLGCKLGGACIEYLDPETDEVRTPTELDLIKLLQLGEALHGVGFVGNPVACLVDQRGQEVPAPLQRIKTAAVVAKYTTKCGSTEVWNEQELEFLLQIGEIVRGSKEAYRAQPCFVTAKETITPLQFPAGDGKVLLILAQKGLPCTIIPMPLTGGTCPCSVSSNIVTANVEILGVIACVLSAVPGAMVGGGVISGIMDMAACAASFCAPEALLQDAGLAQLFDELYGQDLAIGTGYIDASYPGAQSLAEKTLKMQAAAQQGRFNFPVGLLAGGKRFSPVEALLELEMAECIRRFHSPIRTDDSSLAIDILEEVGIGKEFLSHTHTFEHFRKDLWLPQLLDRRNLASLEGARSRDMILTAREKLRSIWSRGDLYQIDEERARAIDQIVKEAGQVLK